MGKRQRGVGKARHGVGKPRPCVRKPQYVVRKPRHVVRKALRELTDALDREEASGERESRRCSRVVDACIDDVEHRMASHIGVVHHAIGQERLARRLLTERVA